MRNNGCFKHLSYREFYVAKYKSSFLVSQLMYLILSNSKIQKELSRVWNRRYFTQLVAVYLIRFWSDFGHHKNHLHAIKVLNLKMAQCDGIQPIASSVLSNYLCIRFNSQLYFAVLKVFWENIDFFLYFWKESKLSNLKLLFENSIFTLSPYKE